MISLHLKLIQLPFIDNVFDASINKSTSITMSIFRSTWIIEKENSLIQRNSNNYVGSILTHHQVFCTKSCE